MNKLTSNETLKKAFFVLFASILTALSLNMFLIPANVFSSGVNGIAQLLATLLERFMHIHIETGYFILLFNIPIGLLGWFKIGRSFTLYSILTALLSSVLSVVLPVKALSANPLMNAIIGGALVGLAIGYALRDGFSTGGMDIVAFVLAKTTGKTIGNLMLAINGIIVLVAGLTLNWASALYTIISIYCTSRVVDNINTSHLKVTAMIVTQQTDAVVNAVHARLIRGITIIPAKGAYYKKDSTVLMIVITRYEMYEIEQAVRDADAHAFVNFLNTNEVMGVFLDESQQPKHVVKGG
ncbi:YitT family protein [Loigolactobacillus iwatensis]|uniref:YitT family protein n=1 Tax=Loigolactobacillus iwatensis TaxID=1267156 RepID=UPI000F7F1E79|nr:YitT family protein [Loigolactobacillus iwatensis]